MEKFSSCAWQLLHFLSALWDNRVHQPHTQKASVVFFVVCILTLSSTISSHVNTLHTLHTLLSLRAGLC